MLILLVQLFYPCCSYILEFNLKSAKIKVDRWIQCFTRLPQKITTPMSLTVQDQQPVRQVTLWYCTTPQDLKKKIVIGPLTLNKWKTCLSNAVCSEEMMWRENFFFLLYCRCDINCQVTLLQKRPLWVLYFFQLLLVLLFAICLVCLFF